ncbi:putative transmembrane protein [Apostichopus japonicus]|uniref:Putative transmembrane protein n=1 Tax=Stichopus japonicus TaxID=307972 RepID=A0A2G8LF73_STIJA|nr:putative transmembrane protein [Apostichopus japonicus]
MTHPDTRMFSDPSESALAQFRFKVRNHHLKPEDKMSTEFINDVLTVKGFTVGGIFLFVMFLLYLLRKLVSFRTECWFCSQKVFVNIFKRNSFTCPHCEQYNGFTEDGDYNKPIPAMYHSQLNQRRIHTEVVGHPPVYHNFLCDDCQANQINKIQQLTAFVPLNEIQPRAWGFIFVITFVRFAAVFATYSLFHTDMRIHNDQMDKSHILWLSVYEQRHSVALAGLSLFILSTLLSGRDSGHVTLVPALLADGKCRFHRPTEELENHNYRYLLSALSLLISVFWAISHLIGLIKSRKRNRSLPTPQPVQDEIDGFYGPSSEEEQVDEEGEEEEEEEEEDVSTTIPSGERTAGTNRDIPGPSNSSRGPVRGGMGSLNLGPPGNLPKKRKDIWTSHIHGDHNPPPSEMVGSRPVVLPARFNYASGSLPGSAASSVVDGPTSGDLPNSGAQSAVRAQFALRAQQGSEGNC